TGYEQKKAPLAAAPRPIQGKGAAAAQAMSRKKLLWLLRPGPSKGRAQQPQSPKHGRAQQPHRL
ncbi:MAG: hypothetical protein J5W83_10230, partial [Candidatus Accumulibacter sp.]|uniref:hypothetical protein n=1 Tax=Accumulibacter sp. TaxID=2053492 RepID=UPI001B160610